MVSSSSSLYLVLVNKTQISHKKGCVSFFFEPPPPPNTHRESERDHKEGALKVMVWWSVLAGAAAGWVVCFVVLKCVEAAVGGERLGRQLERWGVGVGVGYLTWRTTALNAPLARVGASPCERRPSSSGALLRWWYGVGAVCGVVCMGASVAVLAFNLVMLLLHHLLLAPSHATPQSQVLTPVVRFPPHTPVCVCVCMWFANMTVLMWEARFLV